jgi:hypothetical protein
VSSKLKKKEFRLSFKVIFRLIIFCLFVFYSINYLSRNQANLDIPTPSIAQYLPPQSQQKLNDFQNQVNSFPLAEKISGFITTTTEYISEQFRQIKIDIINRVAKLLVDRINQ